MSTDLDALEGSAPPHNLQAERAALGAMMLSPSVADEVSEILEPEDFYRPIHSTIFSTITDLAARGERPDAVAVGSDLARREELGRIGGAPYLAELIEEPPTVLSGGYYANIVAELAFRRRIGEAGEKIQRIARSPEPISEVRDQAAQAAFDATVDRRERAAITAVGDLVGPVIEHIEAISEGTVESGLPTGLSDLDRLTGGLKRGQLWIPAGRTSMGKSVVTQNWVFNAVKHSMRPGILFSVEMSTDEMMQRLISQISRVPLAKILGGGVEFDDWPKIVAAEEILRTLPLYMVDNVRTVPGIRSYCRRFAQRMGDLAVVGVDYLQRLQGLDRRRDRHEEVGGFADALKDLAQDMAMPVLAPCQLNRGPENRTGKDANRPRMADLRESGNLEQTADVIALLYRPSYYDKGSPRAGEADIVVDKNRNGPTDTITVAEQLHVQRFVDMAIV